MSDLACPTNLSPRGRGQRLALGLGMLAVSVALLVWLVASGQPRGARLALLVPLWIAGLGLFQSGTGT